MLARKLLLCPVGGLLIHFDCLYHDHIDACRCFWCWCAVVGLNVNLLIVGSSQETTKLFIFQNIWFLCLWTTVFSQATPLYLSVCLSDSLSVSVVAELSVTLCFGFGSDWLTEHRGNSSFYTYCICNLTESQTWTHFLTDSSSELDRFVEVRVSDWTTQMIGLMINMTLIHIFIYFMLETKRWDI